MVGALALFLAATLGGLALTSLLLRRWGLLDRLAVAVPLGNALIGLSGLALAHGLGMGPLTRFLAVLIALLPTLYWTRPAARCRLLRELRVARGRLVATLLRPNKLWVWYALLALLLGRFFYGACFREPDGGLGTLNVDNLGDLPYHIGIVQGFAIGGNFPPEHPELYGARLTYPFLVDFVAALYVSAGASLSGALLLQNLSLVAALCFTFFQLARQLTGSTRAAHIALPIALFSGGWGFVYLVGDFLQSGVALADFLMTLKHTYTNDAERHLRWGNMLCVLLGTQRSIVQGMPIALAVWRLWALPPQRRSLLLAGILTGTLPLGHVHSFAMLLGVGVLMALRQPGGFRRWLTYYGATALVAVPSLAFMLLGSKTETRHFAQFALGWDGGTNSVPGWALFWIINTGPMIPLLCVALLSVGRGRLAEFYAPFLICFFGPNMLQLAPWIWDNLKVLIYWHLASAPVVALLLTRWWERKQRAPAVICFVFLTLAGGLDVWRVVSGSVQQTIFPPKDVAFARVLQQHTAPKDRILVAPTYNHPVYLAGRRAWLGWWPHLWSHGLPTEERQKAVAAIYAGAPEALSLLQRHQIDYVVVGTKEREAVPGECHVVLNEAFFTRFPVVAEAAGYKLYQVAGQAR